MEKTKLSPPWWEYYHKLVCLFSRDPEIKIIFDDADSNIIKIYVDNQAKADALAKVLPTEKEFGNVILKIEIIPSDNANSVAALYRTIFAGNPILSEVYEVTEPGAPKFTYVVFEPEIVQFYDDNLMDLHGNITTLHQNVAPDVFGETPGVYFCTDLVEDKYDF